jgi:hypothetical protein
MAKQTKEQENERRILTAGYQEVASSSRKYRKFVKNDRTLWLGKHGAVRTGRTVSESISVVLRDAK